MPEIYLYMLQKSILCIFKDINMTLNYDQYVMKQIIGPKYTDGSD